MTIRDPVAYCASLWDWSFLDDCFGTTGIRVSDVDGYASPYDDRVEQKHGRVHRYGHWIIFETKGDGVAIPWGQSRDHRDLVRVGFTVVYLWGRPNDPTAMQVWYEGKHHPESLIRPATLADIHDLVCRWFRFANTHVAPVNRRSLPSSPPLVPRAAVQTSTLSSSAVPKLDDNDPFWLEMYR